eukprot:77757-Pleurochrysis_carterae.AAC.1
MEFHSTCRRRGWEEIVRTANCGDGGAGAWRVVMGRQESVGQFVGVQYIRSGGLSIVLSTFAKRTK